MVVLRGLSIWESRSMMDDGRIGQGGIVVRRDWIGLDGLAGLRRCPVLFDQYSASTFASIQPEKPKPKPQAAEVDVIRAGDIHCRVIVGFLISTYPVSTEGSPFL